jgi:hypothetical protein
MQSTVALKRLTEEGELVVPDLLSALGLDNLTAEPPDGFTLWFTPNGPRRQWEAVATCETEGECLDHIGVGGRHGGGWLILPSGKRP